MASEDCDITFDLKLTPGAEKFLSSGPAYDELLDQALDAVKEAIKAAPKGAYFGVEKTAEGGSLDGEPVIRFTCHFDLPHGGK